MHIPTFIERPAVVIALIYRRLRYGYTFRRIPLTKGYYAIVDLQDYDRLRQYKWHVSEGNSSYATRNGPLRQGRRNQIWMHREILGIEGTMVADHINHNTLDNRRANLRPATKLQDSYNCRKKRKNTSSRYKGVFWSKHANKWRSQIKVSRRRIHLGYFDSEIEAARAYDRAARKHHKEFAVPNFP